MDDLILTILGFISGLAVGIFILFILARLIG